MLLCKTQSRKNIWPFHVSQIISKTLSRSREIQGSQFEEIIDLFKS